MSKSMLRALQILHLGSLDRIAPSTLASLSRRKWIARSDEFGRYKLTQLGRINLDIGSRLGTWRTERRGILE